MKKCSTIPGFCFSFMFFFLGFIYNSSAQTYVTIPGNFQTALGCSGDWQPDCTNTDLNYNSGTGLWERTFTIPAGNWEYKVTIDHSWSVNYGANGVQGGPNISLNLPATTSVTFIYNPSTHYVTDSYNNSTMTVVLPGSFQSEVGCAGDWDPACTATGLTYNPATADWYTSLYIPAGTWEYKVAINNSWAENYGTGGVLNGPNYSLTLPSFSRVAFRYNPVTHVVTSNTVNNAVILAGSFQTEMGCPSNWAPDCYNSSLFYNASTNLWNGEFVLPAGNYEFKVTIDYSWGENYGAGGVLGGPNIPLNIASVSKVLFTYNPVTHLVSYDINPITVVLPGTFQSELGCTPVTYTNGDWEPACDYTRLSYDAAQRLFVGTYHIDSGHWEYKVAINNSWMENYGMWGERNGPNIPLDLKYPCTITFKYNPVSHIVELAYVTAGISVNKFYDANVNGYKDYNEPPMQNVSFNLTGAGINLTKTTDAAGTATFGDLPVGIYSVKEIKTDGYLSSTADSQVVYVSNPQEVNFGNVCLGGGNVKGTGFWMSKNGEAALNKSGQLESILETLRYFGLVNADGSNFDPYTYAQLKTWLQNANAKNMSNMLSAQVAVMYMNTSLYVDMYNNYVYTPGCGFWGNGNFMNLYTLMLYSNYLLWNNTTVTGGNPSREYFECLKNGLDNANNNRTFVQPQPCTGAAGIAARMEPGETVTGETTTLLWPNPSNSDFTLRISDNNNNRTAHIRVLDITGKLVYEATGTVNKDYRFGQNFKPGIYMVQITLDNEKRIIKLIKQ